MSKPDHEIEKLHAAIDANQETGEPGMALLASPLPQLPPLESDDQIFSLIWQLIPPEAKTALFVLVGVIIVAIVLVVTRATMVDRAKMLMLAQEAAKAYPGDYWLSMMAPPAKDKFPGTGAEGSTGRGMVTQDHWINSLKSGCNFCHQLGNALTRDTAHVKAAHPDAKTDEEAWEWRLGVGVRGTNMYSLLGQMGKEPTLHSFADWTERIEKGGRSASRSAPPHWHRAAQRGCHPLGCGRRPLFHARPDFDR